MTKLEELNNRSLEIFRHIVDAYVETGEPVGSRSLSQRLGMSLSPATIRNVMADLESAGLLYAPHTSAGRLPTDAGLKLFIHGLLEIGDLSPLERKTIEQHCKTAGKNLSQALEEATTMLSGLSRCAGLVFAPKAESTLKHVEFINLRPGRILAVTISEDGLVENRIIEMPLGIPPSSLIEATNYLNSRLAGKTLRETKTLILKELEEQKTQLNELAAAIIEEGLGIWSDTETAPSLIIRGQSHLLQDVKQIEQLDRLRRLFEALDTQKEIVELLDAVIAADGIQIFIGSDNDLFKNSGCSLIVAPYSNEAGKIVGAIGVIGPTRLNYGRIIPMVDYTARLISRTIG